MKIIRKLLYFFIVLFVAGQSHAQMNEISNINFNKAIDYYKAKQFINAESAFAKSIGYQARMAQAISAYKIEKKDKAISLFMQSVLLADNDRQRFESINNVAVVYFLKGDYIASTQYYEDALRYSPDNIKTRQFYELSLYLKQLLEARIARNNAKSQAKRAGRGNKSRKLEELTFDREASLRLEDNDSKESKTKNLLTNVLSNEELLNQLLAAGINAIKVNKSGTISEHKAFVDLQLQFEFSSLEHATFTSDASVTELWKRIFELEEGFPATLETIETIPGVRPW